MPYVFKTMTEAHKEGMKTLVEKAARISRSGGP